MTHTAAEISQAIGARLEGDGTLELQGIAAPERAGARDLIYVENAKFAARAMASAAQCLIVGEGIQVEGKTVLRSAHPKMAFVEAAALLVERAPIATGIHATAIVAPLAQLAADAGIGPYAVIGEDVRIDSRSQIGAQCVIGASCWIGDDCRIH